MPLPEPLPLSFWQPPLAALQEQLGSSPEGISEAEAEVVAAYLAVMFWAKQVFYQRWEWRQGTSR